MGRYSKYTDTKFYEFRSVGAELIHVDVRRTDGHDKANSCFSRFYERAKIKSCPVL
jgi:hypothetical protein